MPRFHINLIFFLIFFVGCQSSNNLNVTSKSTIQYFDHCPENGACSLEILNNRTAKIEYDKFGNSYISLKDSKSRLL